MEWGWIKRSSGASSNPSSQPDLSAAAWIGSGVRHCDPLHLVKKGRPKGGRITKSSMKDEAQAGVPRSKEGAYKWSTIQAGND